MSNEEPETLFVLSTDDVAGMLEQMGRDPSLIENEDFIHSVRKGLECGLECWACVMETAIKVAIADLPTVGEDGGHDE